MTILLRLIAVSVFSLIEATTFASTISRFSSISVAATNFQSEAVVTNGLTLGGVRNTSWPAGGIVGTVSNNVASAGLLAVDSTKTNGIAATKSHVESAVGGVYEASKAFRSYQGTLTHAGSVALDFDAATTVNSLTLTGNVTFTTSNLATNRTYSLRIIGCSTNALATYPAWHWYPVPQTNILAGKWHRLTLTAWGPADTNVEAALAQEQ